MRKRSSVLGKLSGSPWTLNLIACALLTGLTMTVNSWAQESDSTWSAASVDESFNAFHQALSATANDLLAGAQRPWATPGGHPDLSKDQSLPPDHDTPGGSQTEAAIRLKHALLRVGALRPSLEPILREEGVPANLAAVVLVESGGQIAALSPKGARGLWQIMPDTARRYGLVVSDRVDERLDLRKSTRAAARYLRDLYDQFGDWPLALAAYNAGEDAVEKAIGRASTRDFSVIARIGLLPLETQNYVPAVLRAMDMMTYAASTYVTTKGTGVASNAVIYAVDQVEN